MHINNVLNAEARQVEKWEQEQRNRILRLPNEQRKQEEWNKVFPPFEQDDSWMEEAVVF